MLSTLKGAFQNKPLFFQKKKLAEHNKKIDNINREIFNCFKSLEEEIDLIAITDETINNQIINLKMSNVSSNTKELKKI